MSDHTVWGKYRGISLIHMTAKVWLHYGMADCLLNVIIGHAPIRVAFYVEGDKLIKSSLFVETWSIVTKINK